MLNCRLVFGSVDNWVLGLVLTLTFISGSKRLNMLNCRLVFGSIDNWVLGLVLTLTFISGS